jgi:type I restriction enzyme, R subunit
MQAIARANRVSEGKNNGLIVDYCGILKSLRQALATFGGSTGGEDDAKNDPAKPTEALIQELAESIEIVREYLRGLGSGLDAVMTTTGFERIAAIEQAKEAINENDETRKRFELMARTVFSKFKACLTFPEVNSYRSANGASTSSTRACRRTRMPQTSLASSGSSMQSSSHRSPSRRAA